jgi:uncharacterized protein (DUF433 family)
MGTSGQEGFDKVNRGVGKANRAHRRRPPGHDAKYGFWPRGHLVHQLVGIDNTLRGRIGQWFRITSYSHEESSMTTEQPRIVLDPTVLAGKPVIRGTRLSVEFVIGLMAEEWNEPDILTNYPGITHEDVMACLAYARDALSSEKVFPSAA